MLYTKRFQMIHMSMVLERGRYSSGDFSNQHYNNNQTNFIFSVFVAMLSSTFFFCSIQNDILHTMQNLYSVVLLNDCTTDYVKYNKNTIWLVYQKYKK